MFYKICQSLIDQSKILIASAYATPPDYVEVGITENENELIEEDAALYKSLGIVITNPNLPLSIYFMARVDELADQVYDLAVSSPAKLQEYNEAEKQALDYKANPSSSQPYVSSWAHAKGWTNDQAADDILKTAATFRQMMLYIRTQRLAAKEQMRQSDNDRAKLIVILNTFAAQMSSLRQQLSA